MKKLFDKVKQLFKFEQVVQEELIDTSKIQILHISDTPSEIHGDIIRLAERIKPDHIIHTGDLVDELKIGEQEQQTYRYLRLLTDFVGKLKELDTELWVVPGNHDCINTITNLSYYQNGEIKIISPGNSLTIAGSEFICAHYLEDLFLNDRQGDYYLYGHNYDLPQTGCFTSDTKKPVILNGVEAINLMQFPDETVNRFSYPRGTDHYRKYNKSMRLL
ncbi:metallophosphoesterase [Natranaerobius thermophilus]|uniref:Metallophosphoesterase n=1 Tax=Natranaerobius thermophilus (strain ATCC BAA-1301 / DSM 18059 / JW/NM-WN-LF) TaxID=457570 RepID=B2A6S9_NATTJ|nr:metallophosphoesterase [Natranaerobius thermophilus]ACB84210.1 metallophosphoesterase [Natranaerobius thermophilus JW/NM-WN-LF]